MLSRLMFLQRRRVDALHRERHALVQAGVGQDLLRLVGALGGVLGVLHREAVRKAGAPAVSRRHSSRDVDVALLNAEVGVADRRCTRSSWSANQSTSLYRRSNSNLVTLAAVAEPQSQKVQWNGQPRLVSHRPIHCSPRIGGHQVVEHAVEERRGQLLEVAHAFDRRRADEVAVGREIADAARCRSSRVPADDSRMSQERALALVVDGKVDERIGAQEASGWSGTCGPPKMISVLRVGGLEPARDLERDVGVPDIGAEADDVGACASASTISETGMRL